MSDEKTPARLNAEKLVDHLWRARALSMADYILAQPHEKRN